jgi:hypothetical protein
MPIDLFFNITVLVDRRIIHHNMVALKFAHIYPKHPSYRIQSWSNVREALMRKFHVGCVEAVCLSTLPLLKRRRGIQCQYLGP